MLCAFSKAFDIVSCGILIANCGGIWAGEVEKNVGGKFSGPLGSTDDSNADSSWCPSGIGTGLNTV